MSRKFQLVSFEMTTADDDDRPVYISGNFNDWSAEDPNCCMMRTGPGSYWLEMAIDRNRFPVYYKYTKGDWNQEELDFWGNAPEARMMHLSDHVVKDAVERWRLNGLACSAVYLPKKVIIEEDFEIPQLGKRRRVWALLPSDYRHTQKRYPVLYLQDAQNLFNEHAPYGNWGIDQKLSLLKELGWGDVIIVAIEHGGKDRIKEYLPFETTQFGAGEGEHYARFIKDTLKPYVDKKFRTKPHRIHTGIGGSSMGGLISVYTGMKYPDVFSKWMVFSPSLWLSSQIFTEARQYANDSPSFVYLYGGSKESEAMEYDLRRLTRILKEKATNDHLINYKLSIHPTATHNEHYWGAEFPRAVRWLFYDNE